MLLRKGAKPDLPSQTDELPLGAAVWGMNPAVVNALHQETGGMLMTWENIKNHNLKYYNEVYIIKKFDPPNNKEWRIMLKKIAPSPFIRMILLEKTLRFTRRGDIQSWNDIINPSESASLYWSTMWFAEQGCKARGVRGVIGTIMSETEKIYSDYREHIKVIIASASYQTVEKTYG